MKKRFYAWLWKKFYFRALNLEQMHFNKGNLDKSNDYIKLQNKMQQLKDELITGEVKCEK